MSEQGVDRVFDAGRLRLASGQRQPAGRNSCSVEGCDVVTAGLAVVVAVDLAAERVGHGAAPTINSSGFVKLSMPREVSVTCLFEAV